jgi:tRNA A37 threonylcarbamoyladenosine synthetase subunit TsaC/SUA5/YrdC
LSTIVRSWSSLLSASLPGESVEDYTDPRSCMKTSETSDIVVDGGIGGTVPSTIIDCTKENRC